MALLGQSHNIRKGINEYINKLKKGKWIEYINKITTVMTENSLKALYVIPSMIFSVFVVSAKKLKHHYLGGHEPLPMQHRVVSDRGFLMDMDMKVSFNYFNR